MLSKGNGDSKFNITREKKKILTMILRKPDGNQAGKETARKKRGSK